MFTNATAIVNSVALHAESHICQSGLIWPTNHEHMKSEETFGCTRNSRHCDHETKDRMS